MLLFSPYFAVAQQELFCTYVEPEDCVAFFDECDRAAVGCFGADMTDGEAGGAA